MRVDSIGIYNNRGFIQARTVNSPPARDGKVGEGQTNNQPQPSRKSTISRIAESLNQLSQAELQQINELFGQINLSALGKSDNIPGDSRPGQLVDIVI